MRFHFKSFSIKQEQSAMKVGTDGVLLGAWVNPKSYPHQILDVGTGTGLVAIMLAQRFVRSQIYAIDIDQASNEEALFNTQTSPWSERLNITHCALQDYNSSNKYDLIVSNPPYVNQYDIDRMPDEYHYEPKLGLEAGENGLYSVHKILNDASRFLTNNGILICEVGNSQKALEDAYPNLPFIWIEFLDGGSGVFILHKCDLEGLE